MNKSDNLITYFNNLISNIPPDSPFNVYTEPSVEQMNIWERTLNAMFAAIMQLHMVSLTQLGMR
ncbi:MAG: hypothetical protein IPN18_21315 [Ignavibacteriales bacterium]|nr:hypothetical protein [Ignavibacteriales bacterium]